MWIPTQKSISLMYNHVSNCFQPSGLVLDAISDTFPNAKSFLVH